MHSCISNFGANQFTTEHTGILDGTVTMVITEEEGKYRGRGLGRGRGRGRGEVEDVGT